MADKGVLDLTTTTGAALSETLDFFLIQRAGQANGEKINRDQLFTGVHGNFWTTADGVGVGGAPVAGYGLTVFGSGDNMLFRGRNSITTGGIKWQNSLAQNTGRIGVNASNRSVEIYSDPDGAFGDGSIKLGTSGTEQVHLTAAGNVRFGSVTSDSPAASNILGALITGAGSAQFSAETFPAMFNVVDAGAVGSGSIRLRYQGNIVGTITMSAGGTAYNTSSDYRLKDLKGFVTGAVARVASVPVRRFGWLSAPDAPVVDGFLAHEVADAVPEAVTGEKDATEIDAQTGQEVPVYQGIDQSKLVPVLWAAVQELGQRLTEAEAKIAALEGAA